MQPPTETTGFDALLRQYTSARSPLPGCEGGIAANETLASQESDEECERQLNQKKRKTVHSLWVILVWFFGILLTLLSLVIVWHWVAPECWRWLSKEDLSSLSNYFAACGGGVLLRSIASKV